MDRQSVIPKQVAPVIFGRDTSSTPLGGGLKHRTFIHPVASTVSVNARR